MRSINNLRMFLRKWRRLTWSFTFNREDSYSYQYFYGQPFHRQCF